MPTARLCWGFEDMATQIDWREKKAFDRLCSGLVETVDSFGNGIGPKTLQGMADKGWIVWVEKCPHYGTTGWQITELGGKVAHGQV